MTITPAGIDVNLEEEMGTSISVPRNAVLKDEKIHLATGFSGAYEMPADVESVSPPYLIEPSNEEVEFNEDAELKYEHNANLETAEDYKDMAVYKFSQSSSQETMHMEEVERSKVKFGPHWVFIKVKSLMSSVIKIGRKKKG